jgi:hypothetical protein
MARRTKANLLFSTRNTMHLVLVFINYLQLFVLW